MKCKKTVGVVFGGMSTEHDVSVVSGTSVIKNLNKEKYNIKPIYISKNGEWFKYVKPLEQIEILVVGDTPKELEKIEEPTKYLKDLDVVFPVLHGAYGEDGAIQGLFELLKLKYVGCKVLASSVCMDKVYTKIILEKAGINQAKYIYVKKKENYSYINEKFDEQICTLQEIAKTAEEKLGFPVFVKPSNSGSSVGINKSHNTKELIKHIEYASKFDNKILIEQNINGREVECAVMETKENAEASCIGEILPAEDFYTFDAKYKNSESRVVIPAKIDEEKLDEIRELAVKAFKAVDGSGLSRVDFFIENETGKIYLNEINTMPGFTKISMYPKLWEQAGINYTELLDKLIDFA